jgi:hypothetical protein
VLLLLINLESSAGLISAGTLKSSGIRCFVCLSVVVVVVVIAAAAGQLIKRGSCNFCRNFAVFWDMFLLLLLLS